MSQWSQRAQLRLWIAAVAITAEPVLEKAATSLFGPTTSRLSFGVGITSIDACQGWRHQIELWSVPGYRLLHTWPILVVLPAFLLWLLLRHRAVGWAAALLLGAVTLPEPVLYGYDVARWGTQCTRMWLPFGSWEVARWVLTAVPVLLILASTCRPGRRTVRLVGGTVAAGLLLSVAADREVPHRYGASEDECRHVNYAAAPERTSYTAAMAGLSQRERQIAFLCSRRGFLMGYSGGPMRHDSLSDAEQIEMGRRACRGERPMTNGVRLGIAPVSLQDMAYLCPGKADERQAVQRRSLAALHAKYQRERAKAEASCRRGVPEGFGPVRQATHVIDGDESGSYTVEDEDDGLGASFDPALKEGLIASAGHGATVIAGTEGPLCLTVRVYRKAPPVEPRGWDRVEEVGVDNPHGRARLMSMDGLLPFPVVNAAGPGRYRIRIYVRGRTEPEALMDEPPKEHHLLVVFPGKSEKRKVYKNTEH
ncbi:hypothetical protein [Actinomadura verrucosospora]|uniref:Uncharacterized protein n=1 Tax=Actinomadura verrucosospora TaxID=46165 RepID=A0A7D4AVK5_ACTVE|nr:hypothetical protein [Actinomadura verrucosospora]QKG26888.1 hypothetical protein ACTIVE_8541 [Actinomadura verrucosospora]